MVRTKKWHTRRSRLATSRPLGERSEPFLAAKDFFESLEAQLSVSLMFLPHFDLLCDLLLNRRTATWNLFVLYTKKFKYTEKMPFYFKFRRFDRHENSTDVIQCLYKMKRTDWLLCLAKNCDWFKLKIKKITKNLNRALSSSMRLSSNRS